MGDTLCCHQTFFFLQFFLHFFFFCSSYAQVGLFNFLFPKRFLCICHTKMTRYKLQQTFYQVSQNTHLGNFVRSFLFLSSNFLNEEMFPWHIDCFGTFFLLIGTNTITRLVIRISRIRDFLILALFTTCS